MSLLGPYVHNIDPIIGTIFGVHLWWYGLSYTLGFFNAYNFIDKRRTKFGLDQSSVYSLCILIAAGVLVGGRAVEVIFYEWPFYSEQLHLIPALWLRSEERRVGKKCRSRWSRHHEREKSTQRVVM